MDHSITTQSDKKQSGSKFTSILDYIQHHYQTLTLAELSEVFHYSEAYLCALIKKIPGKVLQT